MFDVAKSSRRTGSEETGEAYWEQQELNDISFSKELIIIMFNRSS